MNTQRIDKWLWTVRVYKTRTMATEACKKGRIELNGAAVKASTMVKEGDELIVFRDQLRLELKVLAIPKSRLGAKLVPDYMLDHTPQQVVEEYKERRFRGFERRHKGEGRPTKRDRREIDKLKS